MDIAERIFIALDSDIRDRQSLGDEWALIDDETKEEIRQTWLSIINKEISEKALRQ